MSSLKMTFSLTSLILIFALAVMPAIAHVVDPPSTGHNPADAAGSDHALVKSVTVDKEIVKANDILTVTVEFAPSVLATTTPARHATLINAIPSAIGTLSIQQRQADGMFADPSGTTPLALHGSVIALRDAVQVAEGPPAVAGVGGIYQFSLLVSSETGGDGVYKIGVATASGITDESNMMGTATVTIDTTMPTVSNIKFKAAAGNDYPQDDVFTEAFMVEFDAMDSGSRLAAIDASVLTASPANLTFSGVKKVGSNTWAATATPVDTTTADTEAMDITVTVTVMDKAGNSSSSTADAVTSHDPMAMVKLKRPATEEEEEEEETPTPTELGASMMGLSVEAGKFILLVRNEMNVKGLPDTLPDGASLVEWTAMPDLEALLYGGGSIDLTRAKAPKLDHDGDTSTDTRDAGARDLIITEVMWAKNTALTGKTGELDHQWIEIYNPLKTDVGGVTITTTEKRSFQTIADTDVLLDRLSNQVGGGWALTGLGQNGSNDYMDDTDDVKSNFISMFRSNRGKEGWTQAHWSQSTETAIAGHKSTPGRLERKAAVVISATNVPRSPFVINEFGIGNSDGEDWIELRNVTDSEQTLKNLLLTSVEKVDEEKIVFHFHDNDLKVPAKGVVLVASTNPRNTDIAGGRNLELEADDQEKTGVSSIYVVRSFELPTGKFNLILRKDYDNKSADFLPGKKLDKVIDAMGSLKVDKDTSDFNTDFWPLNGTGAPHDDVIEGLGQDFKAGTVYERKNADGGTGEHHLGKRGYTGLGYDRAAVKSDANGGTPGYDNGAIKDKIMDGATVTFNATITISEIMVDVGGGRRNLAQWIELYNSSMSEAVNLNGWKLAIENNPDVTTALNATLSLDGMTISPNQTILIASSTGSVSDPDHFPSTRVVNLWTTKKHRDELEMERRTDQVISATGFHLKLTDTKNNLVDEAGNLDGNRRTRDEPAWALPMGEDDGRRSSLIRVYDEGVAIAGTKAAAWLSADATNLAFAISQTYYGDADDFGTPGFRGGGPLPVSLSKFRPERLDTGEIVVRWITESELNNAGFNILRSTERNGEFTKVNTSLIAGNGTTSERNTYEWKDSTAKPNVVYYYQIQDVSLDGDVTTLRQSRLKGNVSAAGKLTTTWGELKALQ